MKRKVIRSSNSGDSVHEHLKSATLSVTAAILELQANPPVNQFETTRCIASLRRMIDLLRTTDIKTSTVSGTELAYRWGCSKGRISQIRNGNET